MREDRDFFTAGRTSALVLRGPQNPGVRREPTNRRVFSQEASSRGGPPHLRNRASHPSDVSNLEEVLRKPRFSFSSPVLSLWIG